ncbi:tyrosine-protein phosphatase [Streptomyces sp. NPDC007088]|uniref:tyrosine-protein phosphatase n=1 Tax=Streptomyces sp. NPDC007088 TaxID=3364773 RepID=UPI0036A22E71
MGGYRTQGGRTARWSTLYRSGSLAKLRGADLERFRDLGARTDVDLRHPWETGVTGTGAARPAAVKGERPGHPRG